VIVDGISLGAISSYTFTNVIANHTISATFAISTHTITASAGDSGSITPSGEVIVNHGANQSFTITPYANYHVSDVQVDNSSVGAVTSYTFNDVTADHAISATFSANTCVFASNKVTISGGGYVDSYNSSDGPYSGVHGANGPVGTNSTSNGAITMSGGSTIYGDVWVGPGGDLSRVIVMSGGSVIYGNRSVLSSVRDMTPMADPGGGTPSSFTNGTALTSGTYRVSSINLSGRGTGTINGNVTLYVTGSISVSGGAKIVISPGSSLTIYVCGNMNLSGGGIVNQTLDPHALRIYGTLTCNSVNYSGSSALYGTIHAPKASISLSGSSSIYGSVVGKSVTLSGRANVHCDESL
jgi:hypothetical protein